MINDREIPDCNIEDKWDLEENYQEIEYNDDDDDDHLLDELFLLTVLEEEEIRETQVEEGNFNW